MPESLNDAELAAHLAEVAGQLLIQVRESGVVSLKALGKAGDATANQFLMHALEEQRPDDGLLSEESKDTPERLGKSRVWIIDPVDGTREYGEGRTDWAVHIASGHRWRRQHWRSGAARVGGRPAHGSARRRAACARYPAHGRQPHPTGREATDLAARIGAELVPMGSAGAKAMAIVRGEADIYLHSGGQYEWDSCAPVAVALAHGLHCSRIDGSPLVYNQADVYMPDLLICRKAHATMVLGQVAGLAR